MNKPDLKATKALDKREKLKKSHTETNLVKMVVKFSRKEASKINISRKVSERKFLHQKNAKNPQDNLK